ncbi:MAG: UDP-N-acetylglucosamine 2-epimerase (non-hydrolyzing) [Chloroflexi bacterium]|nr:UDP-N-acetylglucosamine 2-epimerase (non-hydrolyzing) [Chloroflexota bacterium]
MPPVAERRRLTVMTVFGTRAEAVKMAPIVRELHSRGGAVRALVCVTAEQRDLLDQVLADFGIQPDRDLDLARAEQTLPELTARVLLETSRTLGEAKPDFVLVQGGTTTAMAAALAAFDEHIPVGHVEAGLRAADVSSPFPEEMNRRAISTLATLHFAPTARAEQALLASGVAPAAVHQTGNTVADALQQILRSSRAPAWCAPAAGRKLVVVTAHRRENFGEPLREICAAILELVERHTDVEVVFPVHPDPSVTVTVRRMLGWRDRIRLIDPLDYISFVHLVAGAYLVLTDSGGVQEEAPMLGKPVLVLREETDRPEGIEAGAAKLVGHSRAAILAAAGKLLTNESGYKAMARPRDLYGDGRAAERIVDLVLGHLGVRQSNNGAAVRKAKPEPELIETRG